MVALAVGATLAIHNGLEHLANTSFVWFPQIGNCEVEIFNVPHIKPNDAFGDVVRIVSVKCDTPIAGHTYWRAEQNMAGELTVTVK